MLTTARNTINERNVRTLFSLEDPTYIVFDTETTGVNPDIDRIVQLSALKLEINDKVPKEIDRLDIYLNPEMDMCEKVIKIHGITNEFARKQKTEAEEFDRIRTFFGTNPIIVGQNVGFDVSFFKSMYQRMGETFNQRVIIDTLESARDLISFKDVKNYSLETLLEYLGISGDLSFHNSMDDVIGTQRLLVALYHEYINTQKERGPKSNTFHIKYISFWNGYNVTQKGIYVTNELNEKIWFSTRYKTWISSNVEMCTINIDKLERDVLTKMGVTLPELEKMTEGKFEQLCKPGRRTIS